VQKQVSGLPLNEYGYPQFSLAERARRFAAIRERMRNRDIDVIVIRSDSSKMDSGSAEGRYLTHIGGNGEEGYVVFDLREDPMYTSWRPAHIENLLRMQNWTTDLRPSHPSFERVVAGRVKELGHERTNVGLVGLGGPPIHEGGKWPHIAYERLRELLPDAKFVDFGHDFARVKAVKSAEEIVCHERSAELNDAAIRVMYEYAQPGILATEVYGRMIGTMVSGGAEMPVMVFMGVAPKARITTRLPPHRALQAGDIILNEITSKYCGYWTQVHIPVSVGQPPDRTHQRLYGVIREATRNGEAALRHGVSQHDLARAIREPIEKAGLYSDAMPQYKGIGLGFSEFPVCPPLGAPPDPGKYPPIEANMVITFEVIAYDKEANAALHLAENYLVTQSGCRRLEQHPIEFRVT
jgi:Xaa-Pro dipeptidase